MTTAAHRERLCVATGQGGKQRRNWFPISVLSKNRGSFATLPGSMSKVGPKTEARCVVNVDTFQEVFSSYYLVKTAQHGVGSHGGQEQAINQSILYSLVSSSLPHTHTHTHTHTHNFTFRFGS
jgi:hypothetical protein